MKEVNNMVEGDGHALLDIAQVFHVISWLLIRCEGKTFDFLSVLCVNLPQAKSLNFGGEIRKHSDV